VTDFPLTITPAAIEKAKEALMEEGKEKSFLRAAIQGGGCSGLQYKLEIDTEEYDHDYILEVDGLKIVVDGYSALVLRGTVLDYASSLIASGFQFKNPNAKRTCGCGSSFGY
jgi:iron-sulfur cluster assembly accessory protein